MSTAWLVEKNITSQIGDFKLHTLHNVDVSNSNITIIWEPVFEWYIGRCGSKNGHQQGMHLKEIGLRVQNLLVIRLSSIVNMIFGGGRPGGKGGGELYDQLMSMRIFTLIMNKIFMIAPKIMRQRTTSTIWIC